MMVSTQVKIEDLCRTCLSKELELISVHEVYSGDITIEKIISILTGIKIEADDGLPGGVCGGCRSRALAAYHFREQTRRADAALRERHPHLLTLEVCSKVEQEEPHYALYEVKAESNATHPDDQLGAHPNDQLDAHIDDQHDAHADTEFEVPVSECLAPAGAVAVGAGEAVGAGQVGEAGGTYCALCAAGFGSAAGLAAHMRARHPDIMAPRKRARPKRRATTAILNQLSENGVKVKWVGEPAACAFCPARPPTRHDHDAHVHAAHADMELAGCARCDGVFLTRQQLRAHVDQHHQGDGLGDGEGDRQGDEGAVEVRLRDVLAKLPETECAAEVCVCAACGRVCGGRAALQRHRDTAHPDDSPRCHLCCKVFASVKSAARHRARCAALERRHACGTCGAAFAHEVSLTKHTLRAHRGQPVRVAPRPAAPPDPAHTCPICGTAFRRRDLLERHERVHALSDKVLECDVCKQKFHRRSNLRSHMRTHTGAASACLCLYCGRGFSNSSNLIVHMRRHTGEKPYKCDFCGKGFPRSSDLQCHRRSHTGEKPCICGVCGKGFSRSNKLSRHMRVHTGLRPYRCSYCDKAFSQSNDLTLHVRRHTGDRPYVCDLCGDRFIQGTALHNHRRAHAHYSESAPLPAPPPAPAPLPAPH